MAKAKAARRLAMPSIAEVATEIPHMNRAHYEEYDIVVQLVGRTSWRRLPYYSELESRRVRLKARRRETIQVTLPGGTTIVRVFPELSDSFSTQQTVTDALVAAGARPDMRIAIDLRTRARRRAATWHSAYCATVASAQMPSYSSTARAGGRPRIKISGMSGKANLRRALAAAQANILARWLCYQPGNILDSASLIDCARNCAASHKLDFELIDLKQLARRRAGAFLAVTGSQTQGGLVRISYKSRKAKARRIALIGKGVCFDTGGINVKPARHMLGMQADMAGAAAALGAVIAAAQTRLGVSVDVWLAVAENLIERDGIRPGDVVKAHNRKTIEVVHTDAEGRMLLADTLSIASQTRPDAMATMATLTGSMIAAVGSRLSGVTGDDRLVELALKAAAACGERLHQFPMPPDYNRYLDSKVADLAQCSAGDEPDHILAALFLLNFTRGIPWLHLDLSAASCKGGLGAVPTDLTGFGANWAYAWLGLLSKWRA